MNYGKPENRELVIAISKSISKHTVFEANSICGCIINFERIDLVMEATHYACSHGCGLYVACTRLSN